MPTHRRRRSSLALKSAELALATPQVVAHRLTQLAQAGYAPSVRDQREFQRMFSEKGSAFAESWLAMGWQMLRAQQSLMMSFWQSMWWPALWGRPMVRSLGSQMQRAGWSIAGRGLAPVHRTAVANAKRLSRRQSR